MPEQQSPAATVADAPQVFVDSSGRRLRWTRGAGCLLAALSVTYVAMVGLGLSGTRVGPLTSVPAVEQQRVIGGLPRFDGTFGLPVVPLADAPPAAAPRPGPRVRPTPPAVPRARVGTRLVRAAAGSPAGR
ncbi:MAG TPA: hypothetical protein VGH99_17230 [Pseudonocardia sp.]|jgi:hypothetical protein